MSVEQPGFVSPARAGAVVGVGLLLVLWLHLLWALLCALGGYIVYMAILRQLLRRAPRRVAAGAALVLTALAFIAVAVAVVQAFHLFWAPHGGLAGLMQTLADIIDRLRSTLPPWASERLPDSAEELRQMLSDWLRANARDVQHWGQAAFRITAEVVIGLVIGLLAGFERAPLASPAWAAAFGHALSNLASAFAGVVSAQLRIVIINTILTALFLLVVLPLADVHLPAARALVVLTAATGLIPIIGNLISNTAIVLVALSVSPGTGLAALAFLVGIHKLEYVLNAHFVGLRTQVRASVLLAAMLTLEAAFGVTGLVAAPIYCAWVYRQWAQPGTT
jgi:predicted PurR-regulated permease PerM